MSKAKNVKTVFQKAEMEAKKVETIREEFYPNGTLAEISFSSDPNVLANMVAKAQAPDILEQQPMTQEQMEEHCIRIRENVKMGKVENFEIRFDQMAQMFSGKKYELGNTICKIRTCTGDTSPTFLFFKEGSSLSVRVFIEGENATAIMAIRGEKEGDYFIKLSEFHMVSFQKNPDPRKEVGLVTSYVWLTARVYSSVVFALTLDPIKNLLLSEWLQAEWKRAKEVDKPLPSETAGGDVNG